ncbi:MAG: hypothetical protein L0207_05310 [Chlamydiae bacterium]|nr:hypothetical protein [Chlamydiota bacterium]
MDTYEEIIQYLYSLKTSQVKKKGLAPLHKFLGDLSHPQKKYPSIHVAGTNGKGSVSFKIAKVLEEQGLKVGLFTSPHLLDFCERITINGKAIEREFVTAELKKLLSLSSEFNFFEFTTLLAFLYFQEQKIDIAVIETGIGGRLDATSVIDPILTIITSIGYDHKQILGNSLESIAREKAGILKSKIPLILGPSAQFPNIYDRAKLLGCPVYTIRQSFSFFDEENQAIAKKALEVLHLQVPLNSLSFEKILSMRPPCRFEEKNGMIFDVAHNPPAFQRLMEALLLHFPHFQFRFVIGMSKDKEIKESLESVLSRASHFHFVKADTDRGAEPTILRQILHQLTTLPATCEDSILSGIRHARTELKPHEKIVICGSFLIMEKALSRIY